MPDIETHCKISLKRTKDKEFRELHKWIDEGQKFLKHNHRMERHFFTQEYKEYIEKKWGQKAVVEWLFHIAIDNMETANKFAVAKYGVRSYDEVLVKFSGKEFKDIDLKKVNSNKGFVLTNFK